MSDLPRRLTCTLAVLFSLSMLPAANPAHSGAAPLLCQRAGEALTQEEWPSRKAQILEAVRRGLGLSTFPRRTALNARITGVIDKGDYLIEKVIFESRPRFYVTANLYVPKHAKVPAPAVLNPHGHFETPDDGKAIEFVQRRCAALAKKGYVAMALDKVGFGERHLKGILPNHFGGWSVDYQQLTLSGNSLCGIQVWDCVRAIDYLVSRREVDPGRLGITGCSGGSTQSIFTALVDERVKVVVPVGYGPFFMEISRPSGCECSHVPGAILGIRQQEVLAALEPRPLLLINERSYDTSLVKQVYEILGFSDRFKSIVTLDLHDYRQSKREEMYAWMNRWLQGIDDPDRAREPETEVEPRSTLRVLEQGLPPERLSLRELVQQLAEEANRERRERWSHRSVADQRRQLRQVLGLGPGPREPQREFLVVKTADGLESVSFSGCFRLPEQASNTGVNATLVMPERVARPSCRIHLLESPAELRMPEIIQVQRESQRSGRAVLFLPMWDFGVVEGWRESDSSIYYMMRGYSLLGARTEGVQRAVDYLRTRTDINPESISIAGHGPVASTVALVAAALDERISAARVSGCVASYAPPPDVKLEVPPLYVFGILRIADIPEIAAMVAPRRLEIEGCQWDGKATSAYRIPPGELEKTFAAARARYRAVGRTSALILH